MSGSPLSVPLSRLLRNDETDSLWNRAKRQAATLFARSADSSDAEEPDDDAYVSLGYLDSLRDYFAERGERFSRAYLLGVSGEAFKFFYDRAQPSRSVRVFLHNPLRACASSLGCAHAIAFYETPDAALDALDAHHATGEPAILQMGDDFPLVFPGRRVRLPEGEEAFSRSELAERWTPTEGFLELGLYGYYLFTLKKREREPKAKEVYLGAFRRAQKIARAERQVRGCFIGIQAFDGALSVLKAKRDPDKVTASELRRIAEWNAFPLYLLIECRRAAIRFLELALDAFEDDEQKKALRDTMKLYRRVVEALEETREKHPTIDPDVGAKFVFDPTKTETNPREVRRFYAAARAAVEPLQKAQDAEYKAVNELRRVLNIAEKTRM